MDFCAHFHPCLRNHNGGISHCVVRKERKISAAIQQRIGPEYAGRDSSNFSGWNQTTSEGGSSSI